jgi:hypothetical protein
MGSWEDFADGPLDPELKRKILALARQGEVDDSDGSDLQPWQACKPVPLDRQSSPPVRGLAVSCADGRVCDVDVEDLRRAYADSPLLRVLEGCDELRGSDNFAYERWVLEAILHCGRHNNLPKSFPKQVDKMQTFLEACDFFLLDVPGKLAAERLEQKKKLDQQKKLDQRRPGSRQPYVGYVVDPTVPVFDHGPTEYKVVTEPDLDPDWRRRDR